MFIIYILKIIRNLNIIRKIVKKKYISAMGSLIPIIFSCFKIKLITFPHVKNSSPTVENYIGASKIQINFGFNNRFFLLLHVKSKLLLFCFAFCFDLWEIKRALNFCCCNMWKSNNFMGLIQKKMPWNKTKNKAKRSRATAFTRTKVYRDRIKMQYWKNKQLVIYSKLFWIWGAPILFLSPMLN